MSECEQTAEDNSFGLCSVCSRTFNDGFLDQTLEDFVAHNA